MGAHFYDESPSGPYEQEARLRPLAPLLRAGIPFVVIADDALSFVHRVPIVLSSEIQLLVPDNLVSTAARVLCAGGSYRVTEPNPGTAWSSLVLPTANYGPNPWGQTFSAWLAHTSPDVVERQYWQNPMEILIHPQSSFHFDVRDTSRTCLNPEPPSSDLASIRFPTWAAFFDMVVDTRFQPPAPQFKVFSYLSTCEHYLVVYSLSDIEGALFENEPYHGDHHTSDFKRLLPQCWKALDEVKDENKLRLARGLLGSGVRYEAEHLERSLIKRGTALGKGLPPPATLLYPDGVTPRKAPVYLRKLQTNYVAEKPTFDLLYRKWPRLFRHLPKF
ncbi:hypothetical protein D9619_002194 [Psilocybe cf. subviscida]|uniref:Uncharacterized protein n=1 Tax=Psilocybe cf. subviscida TaxID=2480587 RepID=A0A8H5F427_9AGAR|nr:hypothetical protein D9619_002194 [Psilocybe cf. subviscida]